MYNPQLETFLQAADAGSFSKAAEIMYITPTAVIKQINLLESALDVKLFERTHRGLTLTKAGVSLYKDAKYIIQYCKDSVSRAKNAMQGDTGIIRIGTSSMTPAQALMELWPAIISTSFAVHTIRISSRVLLAIFPIITGFLYFVIHTMWYFMSYVQCDDFQ